MYQSCTQCLNKMTEFTSPDGKTIFMCEFCGSIYLPSTLRHSRVNGYHYYGGFFESIGDFPTYKQISYLNFLFQQLNINIDIDFYSLTKYQARDLISELKKKYDEKCEKINYRTECPFCGE